MRVILAVFCAMSIASCAQRGDSVASSENQPSSWLSFTGTLSATGGTCNAVYLGTRDDIIERLAVTPVGKGTSHYVLTAYHCIRKDVDRIDQVSILWPNGAQSQANSVFIVGSASTKFDDVAVLEVKGTFPNVSFSSSQAVASIRDVKPGETQISVMGTSSFSGIPSCNNLDRSEGAGRSVQCVRLEAQDAEGLSGSLVVSKQGEVLGIFLATEDAGTWSYYVHALTAGRLAGGRWRLPSTAAERGFMDEFSEKDIACKASLGKACLNGDTTPENVNRFLESWVKEGLGCTKGWMIKFWSDTPETNGSYCGFRDASNQGILSQARYVLREEVSRDCAKEIGGTCKAGVKQCSTDGICRVNTCLCPTGP